MSESDERINQIIHAWASDICNTYEAIDKINTLIATHVAAAKAEEREKIRYECIKQNFSSGNPPYHDFPDRLIKFIDELARPQAQPHDERMEDTP